MCEHCGCRGVEPIAALMDEHFELLEHAGDIGRLLDRGDADAAWSRMAVLVDLLDRHVRREQAGVFAALRDQGDFTDAVVDLEAEHVAFDIAIARLDRTAPDVRAELARLFGGLSEHIDKENLGVFPVAVVTLGARGWETVARAPEQTPYR